jgi:uncharacterized membrane protein HdeD (DUF308 family)
MSQTELPYNPLSAVAKEIHGSWVWFLVLGILYMILGLTCVIRDVVATFATVAIIGWVLVISGLFALIHGYRAKSSSGFLFFLLSALARMTTGCLLLLFPLAGAMSLTLMMASFFIVGGLFRAVGAGTVKTPRWGWSFFSGFVSVALGVLLLVQIQASSFLFIGFAVGVDLFVDGASLIVFAAAMRRLAKLPT